MPIAILTPPFQVPDEGQHFLHAYHLSELRIRTVVQNGTVGAILPSSLIELIDAFLGTRAIHMPVRPITPQPLEQTWQALDRPLDADRREFQVFPLAMYPPPPYLPQAVAIAAGRWMGAGPLALLYFGRLANALVAVAVLAWAVRLMPVGQEMAMLFGLLPMAIYLYASVSPDAATIATAFLFTAVALRGQLRARWRTSEVAMAIASGLVFCPIKPVYIPLLLVGLPAALVRQRAKHILLVHGIIIVSVLAGTVAWLRFASLMLGAPAESAVSGGQANFIAAHPLAYVLAMARSFSNLRFLYKSGVGIFGWLRLFLPGFAYVLVLSGFLFATLAQPRDGPRLPALAVAWDLLLLAGACVLLMTVAYVLWNRVGSPFVWGLQGRYFLPLLALVAPVWCSVVRVRLSRQASLAAWLMVIAVIIGEYITTDLTIIRAYQEF